MTKVVLPYPMDEVWNLLQKEERHPIIVDTKDSLTNLGKNFVIYVSNLSLNVVLDIEGLSKEDKFDLIEQYLECPKCHNIKALNRTLMHLLYSLSGIDNDFGGNILDASETKEFVESHQELLKKNFKFIQSALVVYPLYEMFKDCKLDENPKEHFPLSMESDICSLNVVHLFELPELSAILTNGDKNDLTFYVKAFEEPFFSGNMLAKYFFVKENFLPMMLMTD